MTGGALPAGHVELELRVVGQPGPKVAVGPLRALQNQLACRNGAASGAQVARHTHRTSAGLGEITIPQAFIVPKLARNQQVVARGIARAGHIECAPGVIADAHVGRNRRGRRAAHGDCPTQMEVAVVAVGHTCARQRAAGLAIEPQVKVADVSGLRCGPGGIQGAAAVDVNNT